MPAVDQKSIQCWMCPLVCGPQPLRYYYCDVSGLTGHESQVNKSELFLPHASPSASSIAHESVRFRVKTTPTTSARFRLISHPLTRSISPGISKASSPAWPGQPLTHRPRSAEPTYKLYMSCLCSCRQGPLLALAGM